MKPAGVTRRGMKRREFLAAVAAAGLTPARATGATAFPVHYKRANPFDAVLRYAEPGTDEFPAEKDALELEARLGRIFARKEAVPKALESWVNRRVTASRFYALPERRVRFEIRTEGAYHVGVWELPDFRTIGEETYSSPRPLFRDVTGHVFGKTASFQEQLLPGNPHWRARLDSATGIDVYGNQGIAAGDLDNDGVDEIYVCQPGGLPNRVYKIRPDGSAEDITERTGLGILDESTSALFVDFRNSGNQDLVVLRGSGPLLFLNQGDGTFREHPDAFRFQTAPQGSFTGMAAADFDRDGRVDLYLCCYVYFQSEDQYQYPAPYHDAQNGPPNFLFRNRLTEGGGYFEDVTGECGINENNNRFSFAPAWCDFDGDGWQDLYVANDFGRNNLYRNRNGRFTDEAAKAGVEDMGPGMSASWFDYDGDGRPDLYVSDMWTAPGQRLVHDPAFTPAVDNAEAYRRHSKGNSLYRNKGDGTFEETGAREAVEMGRWAWSSGGFDFDLDGTPEILIASGMVTNGAEKKDLGSFFWRQVVAKTPLEKNAGGGYENGWNAINQLIREDYSWNGHEPNVFYVRREGRYRDASGVSGLDFADDTRTFAVTDFDGDGNPDIVLKNRLGPQIRALQNDCTDGRPAIAIRLRGVKSNRDGIGARVEVNGQVQYVQAGSGFLSQHSKQLHFGLAGKDSANVKITWPSGTVQQMEGLAPGAVYRVSEDSATAGKTAFRRKVLHPNAPVAGENEPVAADTWLLEPVPVPDRRKGPGFVVLYAGAKPALSGSVPVEAIDLTREKDEVAAAWSLFRRYLFEYRRDLAVPFAVLVDAESRAHRVYADLPGEAAMREDLRKLEHSARLALPFPGRYYSEPRRNYFKLGAAFYWAGYPDRALPYLEETLRSRPENWKALLAMGRIHQELGQDREALATFGKVLKIRPDYPPALVNAGEAHLKLNNPAAARALFAKALEADPKCADAANQLGLLSAEANDFEGARQRFQQAIGAQRDHTGAINNLGVLYAKMGQANNSVAAFRYGIQVDPDDDQLYLNLARIYVTMGEREQARAVLHQLLERKPGSAIGAKALSQLEGK
jgi:tetratricopeptide (TPR) repeat protein